MIPEKDFQHAQDERDRHRIVKEMTFTNEAATFAYYNAYARERGFSIRKQRVKRNSEGVINYRRFLCSRAGEREGRYVHMENRKKRPRALSRCHC